MHVVCSTRADGDFHRDRVDAGRIERDRRRLVDVPWTLLDEVHGTAVVEVDEPGGGDGSRGDVVATSLAGAAIGVWVGDCAPVILVADSGRIVAAHAGWRGLAAGVIDRAVDALGSDDARAFLGPCIGPCCYEFSPPDLSSVSSSLGLPLGTVGAVDRSGRPALDVPAVVGAVLARRGIDLEVHGACTGCDDRFYSHRVRRDEGRHVVVAWRDAA